MNIFGGNTGVSYEDVQQRRKIAERLMAQNSATPRNFGEGIHAVARALAGRAHSKKASADEGVLREDFDRQFQELLGGFGGAPASTAAPMAAPMAAPGMAQPASGTPEPMMASAEGGLPASLIRTESGGNFGARNNVPGSGGVGHFGRGQFSHGRLEDAMRAGVIPANVTPEAFLADPQMQQRVENWHVSDINKFISSRGLDRFVGQEIGGVRMTPSGMLAVAHLGGKGGLEKFLTSGGQYNPSDANGTSLLDYAATHGGQSAPQAAQAPAGAPQAAGGINPLVLQLAQLSANPMASPGQRAIIQALIGQQMQASDPLRQLQIRQAEAELAQMQNPQPVQPVEINGQLVNPQTGEVLGDYRDEPEPGFRLMTPDEAAQLGFPEGNYQVGPDGRISGIGGGGVNVSIDSIGTIPQGYELIEDPATGAKSLRPIPGGPADTSAEEANAQENRETSANIVLDEIGIARELISEETMLSPATGVAGGILSRIDSTRAGRVKNRLETIKANIGFDKLQAMRDASPTGGALGAVSEFENRLLQAVYGSLVQSQTQEDLLYNLDRLENIYNRIIHEGIGEDEARQLYREIATGDRPEAAPADPAAPAAPAAPAVTPDTIATMSDTQIAEYIGSVGLENVPDEVLEEIIRRGGQ